MSPMSHCVYTGHGETLVTGHWTLDPDNRFWGAGDSSELSIKVLGPANNPANVGGERHAFVR